MKIFTAYLAHETNTFSPIPTNLAAFYEGGFYRPQESPPPAPGASEHLLGASYFYEEAQRRGDEVVVGLCAQAQPSRPTNRKDYLQLRQWLLDDLTAAREGIDMVLVMMHGAMMAEGCDDCEGDIIAAMRAIVGPDVPIGLLLDLHCNITPTMLDNATIVKACKEYPHTDFDARARELYALCAAIRRGSITPALGFCRVPMLGLFQTAQDPMRSFIDAILLREETPDLCSITLAHGFPWSDFAHAGASVIVYADKDAALAQRSAEAIAEQFFTLRESGQARLSSVDEAIDQALACDDGTVVIADIADNPGGGAPSDSTFVLGELLRRGVENVALAYIWDPAAVDLAFIAGEGARLPMRVGGKVSRWSGSPVDVEVEVLCLRTDATQQHIATGPTPLGRTALVRANGIDIILNDLRQQPFSPQGFVEAGVDPWTKKIVVVKSTHHFYAAFHQRAAQIIYCDTPGALNADVKHRPYQHIRRPIWPIDPIERLTPPGKAT
ncbi:MAG: M81 family metallopeptidase [Sphingomonadaceae bacterium]|nr:M81 family metallopeptidase [Sphingomonadaceae bacterium]